VTAFGDAISSSYTPFTTFSANVLTRDTVVTDTMSIDRETFEKASETELSELSVTDKVLGFLAANADRAYKAREIASQTEVETGAVSTALSRLKRRKLVEHKAEYWAVVDDRERLESYDGYRRATALFNQQLGAEQKDA